MDWKLNWTTIDILNLTIPILIPHDEKKVT